MTKAVRREPASVVRLSDYRNALRAATFLRGVFHEPAWLKEVKAEMGKDGVPVVAVVLHYRSVLIARCIPTAVDAVRVELRDAGT